MVYAVNSPPLKNRWLDKHVISKTAVTAEL